jgi:hypothetical protein
MENKERDRKLDQWLDEALSDYSAAEPRFGLEQRVLNRIRSEEQRSRKWNVWRWMPAFAAIAAVIVVAVAVRPVMEKKVPFRQMNSPIDTRAAEDAAKGADTKSPSKKAEAVTKPANQPELKDTLRGTSSVRRELARVPQKEAVPQTGDRDILIADEAGKAENQPRARRSFEKKAPGVAGNAMSADGMVKAMGPSPPPPPVRQLQPAAAGGIAGGAAANAAATAAKTAPINVNGVPKSKVETAEVQAAPPVLPSDKVAAESMASVIARDTRRKEAHSKPEAPREDAKVMEVYGVRVRFETGPSTQQFPTPAPLSNQEKLALKAVQQLNDSAVAQHKSTEITPIEIKDVEIKPLEGTEKEK